MKMMSFGAGEIFCVNRKCFQRHLALDWSLRSQIAFVNGCDGIFMIMVGVTVINML